MAVTTSIDIKNYECDFCHSSLAVIGDDGPDDWPMIRIGVECTPDVIHQVRERFNAWKLCPRCTAWIKPLLP